MQPPCRTVVASKSIAALRLRAETRPSLSCAPSLLPLPNNMVAKNLLAMLAAAALVLSASAINCPTLSASEVVRG